MDKSFGEDLPEQSEMGIVGIMLGNALELVTIEEEDRNLLLVIHAMRLRKENMYLLEGDY